MSYRWPDKDPDAVLDYVSDWTAWLNGDTLLTSNFIVPTGLVLDSTTNTTTAGTVWLASGTDGQSYDVIHRIVTAGGRHDDRTIKIKVKQK